MTASLNSKPDSPSQVLARIKALPERCRDTCAELVGPRRRSVADLAMRDGVTMKAIYQRRRRRVILKYGIPLPPLSNRGRPGLTNDKSGSRRSARE